MFALSVEGNALIEVGESLKLMAEVKDSLDINVKQTFIDPLQLLQDKDLKEIGVSLPGYKQTGSYLKGCLCLKSLAGFCRDSEQVLSVGDNSSVLFSWADGERAPGSVSPACCGEAVGTYIRRASFKLGLTGASWEPG